MSARSVARLTDTLATPSTLARAASTRPTQLAQVMPSIGRLMVEAVSWTAVGLEVLMAWFPWFHLEDGDQPRPCHRGKVKSTPPRQRPTHPARAQ